MKPGIAAAVALLIDLILGGWGPRVDLREAREKLREMESTLQKRETSANKMQTVKAMLKVNDGEVSAASRNRSRRSALARPAPPPSDLAAVKDKQSGTNAPHKMGEDIAKATDLWNTRVQISRNSFISNVGLDSQQTALFDGVIAVMNTELEQKISQWTDTLKQKDSMSNEDGIRMMHDLGGVLIKTYGEMDQTLPEGWRQRAGDGFELVNFIDPSVAMPLTEVEQKVNKRQRGGMRIGGGQ